MLAEEKSKKSSKLGIEITKDMLILMMFIKCVMT